MGNDRNALIDVKVNQNYDVEIYRRGATFIQGTRSIPDSSSFYVTKKNALVARRW